MHRIFTVPVGLVILGLGFCTLFLAGHGVWTGEMCFYSPYYRADDALDCVNVKDSILFFALNGFFNILVSMLTIPGGLMVMFVDPSSRKS